MYVFVTITGGNFNTYISFCLYKILHFRWEKILLAGDKFRVFLKLLLCFFLFFQIICFYQKSQINGQCTSLPPTFSLLHIELQMLESCLWSNANFFQEYSDSYPISVWLFIYFLCSITSLWLLVTSFFCQIIWCSMPVT